MLYGCPPLVAVRLFRPLDRDRSNSVGRGVGIPAPAVNRTWNARSSPTGAPAVGGPLAILSRPFSNAAATPRAISRLGTWTMASARRDRRPSGPPTGLTRRRRGVGVGYRPGRRRPAPVTRHGASGGHRTPPHQLPGRAATIWTREQHRSADNRTRTLAPGPGWHELRPGPSTDGVAGEAQVEVGEADQLGAVEPPPVGPPVARPARSRRRGSGSRGAARSRPPRRPG